MKVTVEQMEALQANFLRELERLLKTEYDEEGNVVREPKAADFNVVRQFLKDNHIEVTPNNGAVVRLLDNLPFATEEQLEEASNG